MGRELMELFTLGVGNFTETDVKEASRALTGWTAKRAVSVDPNLRPSVERLFSAAEWTLTIWYGFCGTAGDFSAPGVAALRIVHGRRGGGRFRSWRASAARGHARATSSTSVGRSGPCSVQGSFLPRRMSGPGLWVRWNTLLAYRGPWSGSTRCLAVCCSPSGPVGWARNCSTRPTSVAGPAEGGIGAHHQRVAQAYPALL